MFETKNVKGFMGRKKDFFFPSKQRNWLISPGPNGIHLNQKACRWETVVFSLKEIES